MNYKTLCIVTALIILSIGALLIAKPSILGAVEPEITGDVNRDGVVNILDLVEVASQFGEQGEQGEHAADVGKFQSTLNDVPVKVTISPQDNADVDTIRSRDLQRDYWDHNGRFVRFTGVVDYVSEGRLDWSDPKSPEVVHSLRLEGYPSIYVYLLDAPNVSILSEAYQTGHKYEFTGFFIAHEAHAEWSKDGFTRIRVYAFEIRHLGEAD